MTDARYLLGAEVVQQEDAIHGRVVLKVHVLATGKPVKVTVEQSTGFKILDDAAVKAVLAGFEHGPGN